MRKRKWYTTRASALIKDWLGQLRERIDRWRKQGIRRVIEGRWSNRVGFWIVGPQSQSSDDTIKKLGLEIKGSKQSQMEADLKRYLETSDDALKQGVGIEKLKECVAQGALITGHFYQGEQEKKRYLFTCYSLEKVYTKKRRLVLER